jgi:hypothetical protein
MGELYTYNATHLTTVRENSASFRQCADHGAEGGGRFVLHDEAGTQAIVGQKDFSHTESSCSIPLTFRGFVGARTYGRGEVNPKISAARDIEVDLQDLNVMLGFRLIDDVDGKRPAETVSARMTWLMASDYVSGLFINNGRIASSTIEMTKSDYRQQYPGDVVADCALATGSFNYHVNDYGSGPELIFRDDNTSTADSSTLRISNVLADATAVTLHPFKDATLSRDPSNVHSKHAESYAKGTVYDERAATATAFNGERGGTGSNANVKTSTAALARADFELRQHSSETDLLECTVLATSAQVNLMPPGWRIEGKFSHLNTEGYGSFTWFRILEVTKEPIVADGELYEVTLKLSPQEEIPTPGDCTDIYANTPSATYYPLGTSGPDSYAPNVSDGVSYYFRSGFPEPWTPDPGWPGSIVRTWHFPTYGVGGLGTTDYFASGFGNELRFIVVGNGTMTIATEQWAGQSQPYTVQVYKQVSGVLSQVGATLAGVAGGSTEVEISDATDGSCVRIIRLRADARSASYIGMGWSQAVWVAS